MLPLRLKIRVEGIVKGSGKGRSISIGPHLREKHQIRPFPNDAELMGILMTGNIFALKELKQTAPTWDNRKVFNILGLLREYDAKSKGVNAGGATEGELLRELLLKIFMQ